MRNYRIEWRTTDGAFRIEYFDKWDDCLERARDIIDSGLLAEMEMK